MSLDPIQFDLQDGIRDAEGKVHKHVVMARTSYGSQLQLARDKRFLELQQSRARLDDEASPAQQAAAMIELSEINMIQFRILVQSIGDLSKEQSVARLQELTSDDLIIIRRKLAYGDKEHLVPYERVLKVISEAIANAELRAQLLDSMEKELGEAEAPTSAP